MHVIAIAVISIDGYITKHAAPGAGFASKADQAFFKNSLKTFDCTVCGAKTFEVSQEQILRGLRQKRLRLVITHAPEQYVQYAHPGRLEFHAKSPEETLAYLRKCEKQRCAILGGSQIYTDYLKHNLCDELWLTIEPVLFGWGGKFVQDDLDVTFSVKAIHPLSENTLVVKYARR